MATRTVSVNLVASIGQYVSGMNTAAAATMRLGDTATKSTAKAKTGFDLAGKGGLLMGAAVAGGFAAAIGSSMKFEKAMSGAAAATTASGAALQDLRDAAMKAGADTQYSATEAASAITEMGKAGVSTADILGGGLKGALSLAAAGQLDVGKAAEIAATAMTQFKLSGDDLPHVADLLAAGAGKAMGSVEDLGAALNQAGLVASSTGLSIEETTGTLAAFASAGLVGSDAGTSMRSMLLHLQAATGPAQEKMDELGISMYDASGQFVGMQALAGQLQDKMKGLTPATRDAAMAQIFGSDAVRAANILYTQGATGIAEWTGKVNDAGYAADQAAKLQDNLSGDLEKLGGAFENLMINMGEGAQGPLRDLVQGLTGVVDGISWAVDAFDSIPGPVKVAVGALGGLALLNGPLSGATKAIGDAVSGLGSKVAGAVTSMSGLKSAGSGLLGVFGGPWGLALTGATVGLSLLVDWLGKTDEATDATSAAQDGLTAALEASKGAIDANVRAAAAKAAQDDGLLDAAEQVGIALPQVTDAILGQGNAYNEVMAKLIGYRDAHTGMTGEQTKGADAARLAIDALQGLAGQTEGNIVSAGQLATATAATGTAMAGAKVLTDEAAKAQADWLTTVSESLQSFAEPLSIYKGLLDEKNTADRESAEKQAAASKDSSDSWKDFVTESSVSLDEYAAKLEEQMTNQANWRTNIVKVTGWAGEEVGQILLGMGEEGVDLAAQMADGTTSEAQRMARDLIANAHAGGAGAAAALDGEMKVMAAIGAAGAKATRAGISKELGLSVTEVQAIADKYGIALATGINPVLSAIGKKAITIHQKAGRTYAGLNAYAEGGYTGPGHKYQPAGIVHAGEFVFPQEAVNRIGVDKLGAMAGLPGYARGGFVDAASVPRPPSTAPSRPPISTAADGVMAKEYADVTAWLRANQEPAYSGGSASASSSELVRFGHWLQSQGARVSEHPAFGGVTMGAHVRNSKHYSGRAIDVNTRAGTSALEQRELDPLMAAARAAGFQVIWRAAGHFNHGHVESYKTGTPFVPQDGLAYLHQGERVVPREQNLRSREFSGGGRTNVVVQIKPGDLSGMRLSGTLDLGGGLVGVVRGVIAADKAASGRNTRSA